MTKPTEKIGLLFVHGIGEQKPFEHLKSSVSELAELLARGSDTSFVSCAVEDRTSDWALPVGTPTAGGDAPVTLRVNVVDRHVEGGKPRPTRHYEFHCHEVYWADLGARSGIADTLTLWLWGLGQWAAPIYRDLDAAQMKKSENDVRGQLQADRPISQLVRLPKSVAGEFCTELIVRIQLWLAGVAALCTLLTWSLLKRVAAKLLQSAPSPSLLVQYIGDVRTYEERARPGDSTLSDPGFPRRVAIRRRMVTQMVAMGARTDLHGWYVLGHSLGSVVAYNGLTEIGHTLPNYLGRDQWEALPPHLKRDPQCPLRQGQEHLMMPARADWLHEEDVIDRKALFERLRGIVTYGSPLNKFAAIWPRIVATATERLDGDSVFQPGCRWINLQAAQDPVAGTLDRFGAVRIERKRIEKQGDGTEKLVVEAVGVKAFEGDVPQCTTYRTPIWQWFLLAHLKYFQNGEAYKSGIGIRQRSEVAGWLIGTNPGPALAERPSWSDGEKLLPKILPLELPRLFGDVVAWLVALFLTAALAVATITLVVLAGGVGSRLLEGANNWVGHPGSHCGGEVLKRCAEQPSDSGFWQSWSEASLPVLAVVFGTILVAGLIRWCSGSRFDWRMATYQNANKEESKPGMNIDGDWRLAVSLQRHQFAAAAGTTALAIGAILYWALCASRDCLPPTLRDLSCSWIADRPFAGLLILEAMLLVIAIVLQALVNKTLPDVEARSASA